VCVNGGDCLRTLLLESLRRFGAVLLQLAGDRRGRGSDLIGRVRGDPAGHFLAALRGDLVGAPTGVARGPGGLRGLVQRRRGRLHVLLRGGLRLLNMRRLQGGHVGAGGRDRAVGPGEGARLPRGHLPLLLGGVGAEPGLMRRRPRGQLAAGAGEGGPYRFLFGGAGRIEPAHLRLDRALKLRGDLGGLGE
jgi:hypothetical protein